MKNESTNKLLVVIAFITRIIRNYISIDFK